VRPGRFPRHPSLDDLAALPRESLTAPPLGKGLGDFLAQTFPPPAPYIDGLLSDDGGGWIAGEEKLGKTWWAQAEALSLATGETLAGRFKVPEARRVLFIEEEDSPRRTHRRLRALLRGLGYDPDDPIIREALDRQFRIEVWSGFTLDDTAMVARLEAVIADFKPAVAYVDVLRKITLRDLNKASEAGALLAELDRLRRTQGVLFRVVHHFRKVQGFRAGRGSQEIGGSFVLGAWAENSLFFEPIGRKQGAVRVAVQSKDLPPMPDFTLRIEAEGPASDPDLVRLVAEEISTESKADQLKDQVHQAIATLPKEDAVTDEPGVSWRAVATAIKRGERTVRGVIRALVKDGRVEVVGTAAKGLSLYGVIVP
jgi:AAA domain